MQVVSSFQRRFTRTNSYSGDAKKPFDMGVCKEFQKPLTSYYLNYARSFYNTMIDTERIISEHDCRTLIEQDLGRPLGRGASVRFKCPLHKETRGASLAVWENGWRCFGKCQTGGSVIDWVMQYRGLDFKEACALLGGVDVPHQRRYVPTISAKPAVELSKPPSRQWQHAAVEFVKRGAANLAAPEGERARAWLEARGITRSVQRRVLLGYIPGAPSEWHTSSLHGVDVRIPSGILIPWIADGELWGIKVRSSGNVKYMQASGGNLQGALYRATPCRSKDWGGIQPKLPIVFVEGEFDALLIERLIGYMCCPVTLGSAGGRLNVRWLALTLSAPACFIMTDSDEAGENAAAYLMETVPNPVRIRVPYPHKDITDFWQADHRGAHDFLVKQIA